MEKTFEEMTNEEHWQIGFEYKKNSGEDGLIKFLCRAIVILLLFTIPISVCGILWREEVESFFAIGIVSCVLTGLLIPSIFLVRSLQKKRRITRKAKAEELIAKYGEETLDKCVWCYNDKCKGGSGVWRSPEEIYWERRLAKTCAELESAVNRAISPRTGSTSTSSAKSDASTRVQLRDGTELHTENRFGDYKTYLYDERGNNTGLHISGDSVYDDSWHEVGSFNSSGEFKSKD